MSDNPSTDQSSTKPAVALSLDIGSSSVRAALYDNNGNRLDHSSVRLERNLHATGGAGTEIAAEHAIEQVERIIDAVLAESSLSLSEIGIVAVSCFWHSLVGIDLDGNAVTPVFGWADTRAAESVRELRRSFDERETHARTGCRFHPSYWPAKLLWLRYQDETAFRATVQWVSLSELLMHRFFGKAAISVSMASGTGLFNQRNCEWDEPLLSHLSVGTRQLPTVAEDGESFSGLVPEFAGRWPQLDQARWFPSIGDGAANNIGAGCVTRERLALMIGTSGAMRVIWKGNVPERIPPELWCYRVDRRRVIIGGALSDGGGLIAWMKESLDLGVGDEEVECELSGMPPDGHGLTLLPFWAGERSTGWHASAHGTIVGLKYDTRPIEILRASMEAIAYRFARITTFVDEVAPNASIVASGGALDSSHVWTQIVADVLGRPVTRSGTREASSRGAVLLALEMEGRIRDIADAPIHLGQTYEPDMTRHVRFREGLLRHEELYTRLMNQV